MSKLGYKTASGQKITLGLELGRGGEGSVFALSQTALCAKIYHAPCTDERGDKIRLMTAKQYSNIGLMASWPIELILDSSDQKIGFVMPRVDGKKDVHKLYSPKSRRADFLRADWRFLLRASTNIARSFAAVHRTGCVIGDVNHGSVLVAQDAQVTLIDCDSFQIISSGRRFLCEVGVETYTPPELQQRSFKGVVRTTDHDGFGLAVLIFHLLMMGRHPFSGRYLGAGDMPIEKAIAERRFAYGARQRALLMERPPGTPELSIVGDRVAAFFDLAFTTTEVGRRPTAKQWVEELVKLEQNTSQCGSNEAHWYLNSLAACPWCKMEKMTGTILFPFVAQATAGQGVFDVLAFAKRVGGLAPLGDAPYIVKPTLLCSKEATAVRNRSFIWRLTCIGLGAFTIVIGMLLASPLLCILALPVGLAALAIVKKLDNGLKKFQVAMVSSQAKWTARLADWNSRCSGARFDRLIANFRAEKSRWDALPQERIKRLSRLEGDRHRLQLEKYLDNFFLEQAKIPQVGPQKKALLASEGIETALDVDEVRLGRIPGFGPVTRSKVCEWRRGIERAFIFDPTRPVDKQDLDAVEYVIIMERKKCEERLRVVGDEMLQEHARVLTLRSQLRPQVEAAVNEFAQAEADFKGKR